LSLLNKLPAFTQFMKQKQWTGQPIQITW
jgi:hypothetical protein